MRSGKRIFGQTIVFIVLSIMLALCPIQVFAEDNTLENTEKSYSILFISSYSYTWETVPLQIEGIESVLDDTVSLDVEFMDTKLLSQDVAEKSLYERIKFKETNVGQYDAVIVGDDAALRFAMKYQRELFENIPITFEGINDIMYANYVSQDPYVTGVIEKMSYDENIEFARKVQPKATKIVAIVDNTYTGIGEQNQFLQQRVKYKDLTFDTINGSFLSEQEMIDQISQIGDDTILFFLILSEDEDGNIYTNDQVCHMLSKYARVPVYRFVQAGIGDGVLGGNIVLHKESGKIAAEMAMKMLKSKETLDIEVQMESPTGFCLDQKVLDQFHISDSLIPEGAEIIHKKESFFELHGKVLLITLGIVILGVSILLLCMRNLFERRRRVELEEKNCLLEEAVSEARHANQAKSQFLHSVSHDIRTPMNAIIGFTNIALKQNKDENIEKCLEKIATSSEHLLTLINDVLDISRVESGKGIYTPVATNLCSVTDAVIDITQGFINGRNLTFQVEKPKDGQHCNVLTDPVRVREVLVNLLSNAVKFTDDGGTIVFSMGCKPGCDENHMMVWFKVADSGCGMSEEFLPHVFEEFSQEETGARTQYKGTGLGLAIAKRYVELMNGTIAVESKKNVGTTFTVELPLELTASEGLQMHQTVEIPDDLIKLNILMAEDNDLNAEIATVQLEEIGMNIVRVADGEEAVETFVKSPVGTYDMILMDIMMPKMDGYEATRAIRNMKDRPDGAIIPIIAMTANAFPEDVQASFDAGMNAHVVKPISMEEIMKAIPGELIQQG